MHDDLSRPRRRISFAAASGFLAGVPKGTVLVLFTVAGWAVAALAVASVGRGLMFLARHWPF